jgi:hypothetical protein
MAAMLADAEKGPSRAELLDTLRAVHEAVDIKHSATVGEQEKRDAILIERVGHLTVMLRTLLADDSWRTGRGRRRTCAPDSPSTPPRATRPATNG